MSKTPSSSEYNSFSAPNQIQVMNLKATCIYYSSLSDWRGGSAGLRNILNIFSNLGVVTTDVISYAYESQDFGIECIKHNQSLNSVIIHFPSHLPRLLKSFSLLFGLLYSWRAIKKSDLIFAHLSITSGLPAILWGKIFGKPVVFHHIDTESIPIISRLVRYVMKTADAVMAVSPHLTEEVKKQNFKNVIFLPPAVDTHLFKVNSSFRKSIRESMGLHDGNVVIGYTGSFSYIEGIPNLLQAFSLLIKKHPNIRLLIVGGKKGKMDDDILQLVKDLALDDNVKIVPPQPHEMIPKFLSACDITCCPKIDCVDNRVALPIKVVEYLSMGLPTVCSSVGGICYAIQNRIDGFLVKPSDISNLENTLDMLISNPEFAKKIGTNGREKAIEKFSFQAIERKIKNTLNAAVNR